LSDNNPQAILGQTILDAIKEAVKEAIREAAVANGHCTELLTPEELADKLKLPISWIYEQSRQGKSQLSPGALYPLQSR